MQTTVRHSLQSDSLQGSLQSDLFQSHSTTVQKLSPCPICQSTKKKCVLVPRKVLSDGSYSKARLILCYYNQDGRGAPEGYVFKGLSQGQIPSGKFLYVGGRSLDSLRLNIAGAVSQGFVDKDGNPRPAAGGGGVSLRGKAPEAFRGVYTLNQMRLYTLEEYQKFSWQKDLFRQLAEEEAQARAQEQLKDLLSIEQRDREYRRIIDELNTQHGFKHEFVLTERGLSSAGLNLAKEFGFCSWKPSVKIPSGISPQLAGANHTGSMLRGTAGMTIPCRSPYGEISGFQIRPDSERIRADAKYIWLSSASDSNGSIPGNGPALPNGDLPHYCWIAPDMRPEDIREVWLVEGGIKSFLSAAFLWQEGIIDIAVIGAPGNFFGTETIKSYLEAFKSLERLRLMVDAGMTENEMVARSYFKAIRLIKSWGHKLTIGWWGQLKKKSSLDLDELIIPTGNTIKVERIKPGQILLIDGEPKKVADVKNGRFDSDDVKVVVFSNDTQSRLSGVVQVVNQIEKIEWISDEAYFELHSPKLKKIIEPFQVSKPGTSFSDFPLPSPWENPWMGVQSYESSSDLPGTNLSFISHADEGIPQQIYHPEDRLEIWREFVTGGDDKEGRQRYVLDTSAMGSGKSHTAGLLSADALGSDHVTKVIYLTTDPQNPSAMTFSQENGWKILRGRDHGRTIKTIKGPDGSESKQIRRVNKDYRPEKDGPLHMPSNCDRAGIAELLANHNVPPNAANICNGCVFKRKCNLAVGNGYGYLADRKDVMMSEKIIAHPEAIDLDEIDENEVVALVCEEASTFPWFKTFEVSNQDIERTLSRIYKEARSSNSDAMYTLVGIIEDIQEVCRTTKSSDNVLRRYGWDHGKFLDWVNQHLSNKGMSEMPFISTDQLERVSHQNLQVLEDADQWEGADQESREALRSVRSMQTSGEALLKEIEADLAMRWVPDFYRALRGDTTVRVTWSPEGLSIQVINERLRSILTHSRVAVTILLDGTEKPSFFEKQLGQKVHHVAAELPERQGEIEVIQVHGLGLMSAQRSKKQQADLKTLIEHIRNAHGDANLPVIDLKDYASQGDGIWHKDSRGSNLYATADALILVGVGFPNIGTMRDEYALLNGYHPSNEEVLRSYPVNDKNQSAGGPYMIRTMSEPADPGLAYYIRQKTLMNYYQAIGRLRAIRRPGAKLTVYAVTDYPFDEWVTIVNAKEVLVSRQTVNDRIEKAIDERIKRGYEITVRAVAKHVKCSVGYVSKSEAWKSYRARVSAGSGVFPHAINNNKGRKHHRGSSNVDGARITGASENGGENGSGEQTKPIVHDEIGGNPAKKKSRRRSHPVRQTVYQVTNQGMSQGVNSVVSKNPSRKRAVLPATPDVLLSTNLDLLS